MTPDTSRIADVMRHVRERIDRRALPPGARLPSVRAMAQIAGCAKSTVVEAYNRLVAEGVIKARQGSGFFVAAPLAPLSLAAIASETEREIDPLWVLRQSMDGVGALKPGCGWLPHDWLVEDSLRKGIRALARSPAPLSALGYDNPRGPEPLLRILARRLLDQGVACSPDQILLTDSATHAIDLVLRFLVQPGDTVLVDDPCFFNYQALLLAHRARVVGVTFTPSGPDVEEFEAILSRDRPRLYITNSGLHNPTGASVSPANAHRVLRLAEEHDLLIVEDDVFGDFEEELAPRLAAFDGLNRVIRVGSFSKLLSSSVRCGHIAARPDWIAALTDLRISTSLAGNPLTAQLLHALLTDGGYRRHLETTRTRLSRARDLCSKRLRRIGVTPWIEPNGGMFLWGRLPDGVDSAEVARLAWKDNIVFAPGNVFSVGHSAAEFMRFNVTMMGEERIYRTLARLCDSCKPEIPGAKPIRLDHGGVAKAVGGRL